MELTTDRLLLREVRPEDREAFQGFRRSARFRKYTLRRDNAAGYLDSWTRGVIAAAAMTPRTYFFLTVVLRDDPDTPIGVCTLSVFIATAASSGDCSRVGWMGWEIDERHWNRGYATEAVRRMLDFAFRECGVSGVQSDCFRANRACLRVMDKLGMRRVVRKGPLGWLDPWRLARGYKEMRPIVRYRISAEQWAAAAGGDGPASCRR